MSAIRLQQAISYPLDHRAEQRAVGDTPKRVGMPTVEPGQRRRFERGAAPRAHLNPLNLQLLELQILGNESHGDIVGLNGAAVADEVKHEGKDEEVEAPERDC